MKNITPLKALWYFLGFGLLVVFLTIIMGAFYNHPDFPADKGAFWYYWQLPEATFWGRVTGWGFFIAHFLVSIYIAYKSIKEKKDPNTLSVWNFRMLYVQMFFILLHLFQTYFWYDALTHDTPVWLSQYSVIVMLVMIMILLNDRRGLIFGKKVPLPKSAVEWTRKYHGYYILLALTFTFWYHPMEPTVGHLFGFFYMFLLLAQAVFMNTKVHFNALWLFVLEFFVLIHAVAISLTKSDGGWPMFLLGFAFLTVFTQIYLLKLGKKINISLQILYVFLVLAIYSGSFPGANRTLSKIYEITFIPVTEYGLVFLLSGIIAVLIFIFRKISKKG